MLTWCCLRTLKSRCFVVHSRQIVNRQRQQTFQVDDEERYPKITVPQRMVENLNKQRQRKVEQLAKEKKLAQRKDSLIIACKRKEFNHYEGQIYKVFDPKMLASFGWKHRNCPADSFTIVGRGKNPSLAVNEVDMMFKDMELDERILYFLQENGINHPTNIQSLMFPAMITRRHIACAAETGSGKTYAYLIPCVQDILKRYDEAQIPDVKNSPSVIIVMPTLELAIQVKEFCDKIADYVHFKPVVLHSSGGNMQKVGKSGLHMDVLISTPGILKRFVEKKVISISELRTLVLDEADTLLDDSFNHVITSIFHKSEIDTSVAVQVVLVSATFPRDIDNILGDYLAEDSFTKITTEHLHKISPHVNHKFMKMKSIHKLENILTLVQTYREMKMMIFCNNNDTCHWLSKTLMKQGMENVCLTAYSDAKERIKTYKSFQDGEIGTLVCTDIASRGLDTTAVNHVINFDFPPYMSDYIHRAGRVGRVGSSIMGQVTSFVIHPWDVDLVWKIEVAVRQGKNLNHINANIKRKIDERLEAKRRLLQQK